MTTYYVYDMNGNVLAEADGSKAITKYYVHGQGLIGMVTATDSVYNYHYNAIGSTIAITDASQNVVNKYSYQPFGEIMAQEEQVPQPFKYVGQYGVMHEPNGFYYMRARYYDPKVGRFVSEDPIGFEGGTVNVFEYVGNQPVSLSDPRGLSGATGDWTSYPPGYPPGPVCNVYKKCCRYEIYIVCMNAGDNGWSNCVRKCLLDRWHNCKYDHGFWNDHHDCWFNVCKKK